jgi:hypothetical protein
MVSVLVEGMVSSLYRHERRRLKPRQGGESRAFPTLARLAHQAPASFEGGIVQSVTPGGAVWYNAA